ncbi:glycyl-tRNA synthetase beta chain [Coriobacterium glomerans PW2]|uniref:Glycine--tRNA ligase beta subunit n=1 Tax=Coriobacterium glomerans (strain ATCC 49209 / DSM 20642 / JCM 10262 / PW2) TaxID=700015 RepID=F2N9F8_CORGP|nr:glycine--tRNA ligase subunit beta [Coriobacterium glomerans]AEB06987.1 glycyl-tRNA synthetase beta chain [Coriobacterium glomerans PW2]
MTGRDYLIELGCEELPAHPLYRACAQFGDLIERGLADAGLAHGPVRTLCAPRRMAVIVADVAAATEEVCQSLRGPAAAIAFDSTGAPTKAAEGFARGRNARTADLVVRDDGGRDYVFLDVWCPPRSARDILADAVPSAIARVSWPRSQRWGRRPERFARPIRWLVSLLGDTVVPFSFAGVEAGRRTRGLRVLGVEPELSCADAYERTLEDAGVIVDARRRRDIIERGVHEIERDLGARADMPRKVFEEVVNLVEYPRVLRGSFDEAFLDVPHEIICDSMLSNQRYFPLYDEHGRLTRNFVLVANTPLSAEREIIAGNERVVRARLFDAKFFYDEDLDVPLETLRARLERVGFQKRLGSLLQKSDRIERLAARIAQRAGFDAQRTADTCRAARFAKADLVSAAVVEFTSQQGVMGGYYARAAGEPEEVAVAIRDHYRPRFAGDALPETVIGAAVAIADKLDTIAGIFAADEAPTGSSDPYALRRAAIGIIAIARDTLPIDLAPLIEEALRGYAEQGVEFDFDAVEAAIRSFIANRLVGVVREEGAAPDTARAVASVGVISPADFIDRCLALDEAREHDRDTFEDLAVAYARASHIADPSLGIECDRALMGTAEIELLLAVDDERAVVSRALRDRDYARSFSALAALRVPVDRFFEEVLVMDEDRSLRENRLKLLNRFVAVFSDVADIGELARKRQAARP